MNTNNVKTKLVASVLAVVLAFVAIPGVNVSADSEVGPGYLGGTPVYAKSSIYYSGAYGTTYTSVYDAGIHAEVTWAEYTYINQSTLVEGYKYGSNAGTSSASVNFNAPSNCYSKKVRCDHHASRVNEYWGASTDATY